MKTLAIQFAERMGCDGQTWETADGIGFVELAESMGADVTYSSRDGRDEDGEPKYVDGYEGGYISGDPIRYRFPDGSAVVEAGDGWDLEGDTRYSWAGS